VTGLPQESERTLTHRRNYVLFILTLVYAFNFIDRQILIILQESIKAGPLAALAFVLGAKSFAREMRKRASNSRP
jgi:hypothetical protein